MEMRRNTEQNPFGPAVRLAWTLSLVAGTLALALDAIGVARPAIVLSVILVGFGTSLIRTARATTGRVRTSHRLVTVPLRNVSHPVG